MNPATTRRAFTLIELLVVILILAVVIAIIVPALGGARNAAKGVSSRALLTQIANAASAFTNDNDGALPGYFTAEEMGDSENGKRGFTEMENILLDLAGGIVDPGGTGIGGIGGSDVIKVGPTGDATVQVDLTLIGADTEISGAYFTPDAKSYRAGTGQEGEADHKELPDLIDAWGTPALAWRRNQFGPSKIESEQDFAAVDSSDPAWFYWNTNAGVLEGATVGKLTRSQVERSIIGGNAADIARRTSLVGFLGSPAFPDDLTAGASDLLPAGARGDLVLHSAGADGYYMSRSGKGAKQFSGDPESSSFAIEYSRNFFNAQGRRLETDSGEGETEDILRAFDDLIQTGN